MAKPQENVLNIKDIRWERVEIRSEFKEKTETEIRHMGTLNTSGMSLCM